MAVRQEVQGEQQGHHPDLLAIMDRVEINLLGLLDTRDPNDPEGEAWRERELFRAMIMTIA